MHTPLFAPDALPPKAKTQHKKQRKGKKKEKMALVCARPLSFFLFFSFPHYDQVKIGIRSTLYRDQQISGMNHG